MGGRGESDWVADPRVLANGTRVRIIADGRTGEIFRMIMVAVRFGSLPSAWGIEPRYMVLLSGRTCKSFSPDDIEPLLDHPPPNGWDTQESKELQLSRGSLPAQFRSHSS